MSADASSASSSSSSSSSSATTSSVGHSDQTGIEKDGWFMEVNSQWPGIACSLEIEKKLHEEKTEYQHIVVYQTKHWGNVLILDGVIQLTTRDEFSYQEMIAHLPLFAHPNPESVLVIGGGDGGVIREIVKHRGVKEVVICEIDKGVIEAGKKYFPTVAAAWDDKRVKLHVGDGAAFMKLAENEGKFDVIITDSSDPVGPAQALFESPFYNAMAKALKAGGRVCTQAECYWKDLTLIKKLVKESRFIYDAVEYASTQTPTYPLGQIGFLLCAKAPAGKTSRKKVTSKEPRKVPDDMELKYYSAELHAASFILPKFAQEAVDASLEEAAEFLATQAKEAKDKEKETKKGAAGSAKKGKRKSEAEEAQDSSASSSSSETQSDAKAAKMDEDKKEEKDNKTTA